MRTPEEAKAALDPLFSEPVKVTPINHKGKPALRIERAAMYSVPEYTGKGGLLGLLQALASACGGNMVDEIGSVSHRGCDTCDYGSLYGVEYAVWEE